MCTLIKGREEAYGIPSRCSFWCWHSSKVFLGFRTRVSGIARMSPVLFIEFFPGKGHARGMGEGGGG